MPENARGKVLEAIETSDYGLTQRELTEKTGFSRKTVRKVASDLREDDSIEIIEVGASLIHHIPAGDRK